MRFAAPRADLYPYLVNFDHAIGGRTASLSGLKLICSQLVNIGSGVSMIKVSGPQQFERIGGSSVRKLHTLYVRKICIKTRSLENSLGVVRCGVFCPYLPVRD